MADAGFKQVIIKSGLTEKAEEFRYGVIKNGKNIRSAMVQYSTSEMMGLADTYGRLHLITDGPARPLENWN